MPELLQFPHLDLEVWESTRDTIHIYSRLLGKIRQALTPFQEKWWHISLHVAEAGLTTTPIPLPDGEAHFTLLLNLATHQVVVTSPSGDNQILPLHNQSPQSLMDQTLSAVKAFGVEPEIDQSIFASTEVGPYVPEQAETYLAVLKSVHAVFQQFKATLPGKTSPVQLWPHHFDLSMEWFSGREADVPEGEEGGDEQIGFGFATGDETVPQAYFYANPWPFPAGLTETALPEEARWHTDSWQGGLLLYNTLSISEEPAALLKAYLEAVHKNATAFMQA